AERGNGSAPAKPPDEAPARWMAREREADCIRTPDPAIGATVGHAEAPFCDTETLFCNIGRRPAATRVIPARSRAAANSVKRARANNARTARAWSYPCSTTSHPPG